MLLVGLLLFSVAFGLDGGRYFIPPPPKEKREEKKEVLQLLGEIGNLKVYKNEKGEIIYVKEERDGSK